MSWLEVRPDAIPDPLRRASWVLWRAEPRGEAKPAKVPYQIRDPERRASSTDAATWSTYADAVDAWSVLVGRPHPRGPVAGLGVVLVQIAGVTCIDLDNVLAHHELDPAAVKLVRRLETWTERSPSGRGLHCWVRGRLPRALIGDRIEVYSDARYIAVTGQRWPGTPDTLAEVQPLLDHWCTLETTGSGTGRTWTGPTPAPPDDLAGALLARLAAARVAHGAVKRWQDGYLVELLRCPWAAQHSNGPGGAVVAIRASGAWNFRCLHAHCASRRWRDFRAVLGEGTTTGWPPTSDSRP